MSDKKEIQLPKNSASRAIIIGALFGSGAGIIAAMLLNRRAKKQERESMITPSEAIQLGLLIFGLFRAISALGEDDK